MAGFRLVLGLLLLCAAEDEGVEAISDSSELSEPSRTSIEEHLFTKPMSANGKSGGCPFSHLHKAPESVLEVLLATPEWVETEVLKVYRSGKQHYPGLYLVLFYTLVAVVIYRAVTGPGRPPSLPQALVVAEDNSPKDFAILVKAEVRKTTEGKGTGLESGVAEQMVQLLQEHAEFRKEIVESHEMLKDFLSSLTDRSEERRVGKEC